VARNSKLQQGLYDLISNVLVFEVEGSHGQEFHFRLGIEDTSSFKDLDGQTQARLKDLYIDYFYRRQDDFWRREALRKLPALKRVTNMLICGEDLGMVPACVPGVMKQLGLLTLEVQRMPKVLNQQFSRPKDAPYLSVVTPSTHDMSTIRGWWEEDRGLTQRFYNQELGRPGEAPRHCEPWVNEAIVGQHLASPAMWSIFQLQDLLGIDQSLRRANPSEERINIPANPKHYWRYRMHLTLEALVRADPFSQKLKSILRQSGRLRSADIQSAAGPVGHSGSKLNSGEPK
jgi:4-alpha-glucanotransferase